MTTAREREGVSMGELIEVVRYAQIAASMFALGWLVALVQRRRVTRADAVAIGTPALLAWAVAFVEVVDG